MNEIDVLFKEAAEKAAVGPPPSVQRLASAARRTRRKAHAVIGLSGLAVAGVAVAATTQLSHAGSETREEAPVVATPSTASGESRDGLDCPSQGRRMSQAYLGDGYPTTHEAVAGLLGPGDSAYEADKTARLATMEIYAADGTMWAIVTLERTPSGWAESLVTTCADRVWPGE